MSLGWVRPSALAWSPDRPMDRSPCSTRRGPPSSPPWTMNDRPRARERHRLPHDSSPLGPVVRRRPPTGRGRVLRAASRGLPPMPGRERTVAAGDRRPVAGRRVTYWKFLRPGGVGPFSTVPWPAAGTWLSVDEVSPCSSGIHACRAGDLPYWLAEELWVIELDEPGPLGPKG